MLSLVYRIRSMKPARQGCILIHGFFLIRNLIFEQCRQARQAPCFALPPGNLPESIHDAFPIGPHFFLHNVVLPPPFPILLTSCSGKASSLFAKHGTQPTLSLKLFRLPAQAARYLVQLIIGQGGVLFQLIFPNDVKSLGQPMPREPCLFYSLWGRAYKKP